MSRPTKDEYFMAMARLVATRTTCLRRAVGCVLVDARGHVRATGYNGVGAGLPHCNQHDPFDLTGYPMACEGAFAGSGIALDTCQAIHAEQNALLQCSDIWAIDVCYCTTFPCVSCTKLLLGTSCRRIVYAEDYAQREAAERLWMGAGRASHMIAHTRGVKP